MRVVALVAVALVVAARPSPAQLPHLMPPGSPWIDVNYPKLYWTPRDGLAGGVYLALIRQLSYRDADMPPPYSGAVSLDAELATSGTRRLTLDGRFPAMLDGWRFTARLEGFRGARENYYGLGNGTGYSGSNVTPAQEDFYHVREDRLLARGEVQRRIVGGLRLLAGLHAERWKITPPLSPSVLGAEAAAGVDPTIGTGTTDLAGRAGLIFDTRNDEVSTDRGVLLQAIHAIGGGDLDYTRTTVSAAGYLPLREALVVAGRVVAQGMGGTPRLGSYALIEASERPFSGLGGIGSHRGLRQNRFLGRHKLFLNLDARYHVLNLPRTARVSILGFFDVGRVFEGESFRLTGNGLKVGAGTGLFLQIARAGVFGGTVGLGPDGVALDFGSRWTF